MVSIVFQVIYMIFVNISGYFYFYIDNNKMKSEKWNKERYNGYH